MNAFMLATCCNSIILAGAIVNAVPQLIHSAGAIMNAVLWFIDSASAVVNAASRFIHLAGAFVNAALQSIPFSRSRDPFSWILMAHNHFHLFRTHDEDDAVLSKDIVTGYQGPHLHIALSFCIHWGGSLVISLPDGITHVPWMRLPLELSQFCALAKQNISP